jgi:hypothetical protein
MFKPATDRQRAYLTWSLNDIDERGLQGNHRNQAMALYHWAAPRSSSSHQVRYFDRYGADAMFKRINKVRRWLGLELI